ncbi:hypothetical protein I79_004590 [Cricetulus griseus]|uniref:Uncharacterized protein n=1 Tax=Cricetulus griseus TaxID=10029 RepID=G3H2Y5_CRIGR|nr:hypothetical protein I79_004590 [Cricetulus griseus]
MNKRNTNKLKIKSRMGWGAGCGHLALCESNRLQSKFQDSQDKRNPVSKTKKNGLEMWFRV